MPYLEAQSVSHCYGEMRTLDAISFFLETGEIGCLMGPSGSGKSTALSCIAGLEKISGGSIRIDGVAVSADGVMVSPEKRGIGMLFQECTLFPHLDTRANILFNHKKQPHFNDVVEVCHIAHLLDKFPHELSGGEQQRVALARAVMRRPKLLLLDEPFSKLDTEHRTVLAQQIREIVKQLNITVLIVTHDQHEAFMTADVGGVLNHGTLCQWDSIENLYHNPQCAFVADFVGDGVLLNGYIENMHAVSCSLGVLQSPTSITTPTLRQGDPVKILVRPDDISIYDTLGGITEAPNCCICDAHVTDKAFRGPTIQYTLRLENEERVYATCLSSQLYAPGQRVRIQATMRHFTLFPSI